MASKLFHLFLLFLLSLVSSGALAQYLPGKRSGESIVLEYRKTQGDSLQVRKSKVEPERKRQRISVSGPDVSVGAGKTPSKPVSASVDKKVKASSSKVDSVKYEPRVYRLGERVIMEGDSGNDVKSVARILVKKLYFDEDSIIYTKDGAVVYDGDLVRAVKHFQEFNGFYPDGIIGRELIKALRRRK